MLMILETRTASLTARASDIPLSSLPNAADWWRAMAQCAALLRPTIKQGILWAIGDAWSAFPAVPWI